MIVVLSFYFCLILEYNFSFFFGFDAEVCHNKTHTRQTKFSYTKIKIRKIFFYRKDLWMGNGGEWKK